MTPARRPVSNHQRFFTQCIRHLERPLIRKKYNQAKIDRLREELIYPTFAYYVDKSTTNYPEHFLNKETQARIQNSITQSMVRISNREAGSQKGVMYFNRFIEEIVNEVDNPEQFMPIIEKNGHVGRHPYFKLNGHLKYHQFISKTGVSPAACIKAFLEGPIFADCGTTVEAVYLEAMCNILGKQKFDSLFSNREKKLKIGPFVCFDEESSLDYFTEFIDPRLCDPVVIEQLQIGDHVCVRGVPGYQIKRPFGNWSNLHAVLVGFKEGKPLLSGLGISTPLTIPEITSHLIDSYNEPQTPEEETYIQKVGEKAYYDPKKLQKILETALPNIGKDYFFETLTHEKASALGAGTMLNFTACRLSPYVLSAVQAAPASENLRKVAHQAKSQLLAHQLKKLVELECK